MTDEELQAIEARANAATMWTPDQCNLKVVPPDEDLPEGSVWAPQGSFLGGTLITLGDTYEDSGQDWNFVAHARQDVKALVAEVRRLRGLLEGPKDKPAGECLRCGSFGGVYADTGYCGGCACGACHQTGCDGDCEV